MSRTFESGLTVHDGVTGFWASCRSRGPHGTCRGREELPLRFNAVAVNMSNVGPRTQQRLEIDINRTSTDEERAKLMEVLISQTQAG